MLELEAAARVPSRVRWKVAVRVMSVGVLAATALTFVADTQPAGASNCEPSTPPSVTSNTGLDNLFQSYGNRGTGTTWTGGDGTESVALPDGRVLWAFDDTFLGAVVNGQRNRKKSPYLHNSMVIESQGALGTTLYTAGRRPSAYVNLGRRHFKTGLWPGGMVVNGGSLQVMMVQLRFKPGVFTFREIRDYLAVFDASSLQLRSLSALPKSTIDWAQGVLTDGGFTYIYGSTNSNVYVARVAGTDLSGVWAYYNGSGWTTNQAQAAPIESGVERAHMNVSKVMTSVGPTYLLTTMASFGSNMVQGAYSCFPNGPFGPQHNLYKTPEPSAYPSSDGVATYGPTGHPELSGSPNTLVVSYDVNPIGPQGLSVSDASIFRPRFINITMP